MWLAGSLFYNAFSVIRLYSINDMMVSKQLRIGEDLVESGQGLILRYYTSIRLEGLRKTVKT
jgi:hypothetical protein